MITIRSALLTSAFALLGVLPASSATAGSSTIEDKANDEAPEADDMADSRNYWILGLGTGLLSGDGAADASRGMAWTVQSGRRFSRAWYGQVTIDNTSFGSFSPDPDLLQGQQTATIGATWLPFAWVPPEDYLLRQLTHFHMTFGVGAARLVREESSSFYTAASDDGRPGGALHAALGWYPAPSHGSGLGIQVSDSVGLYKNETMHNLAFHFVAKVGL